MASVPFPLILTTSRLGAGVRIVLRVGLASLVLGLAVIGTDSPRAGVGAGLAAASRQEAFSVLGWEAAALADKASVTWSGSVDPIAGSARVRDHYASIAEVSRLRARRDDLAGRPPAERGDLAALEQELASREANLERDRRTVEAILGAQIDAILKEQRLRSSLFTLVPGGGWPLPMVRIDPEVFFSLQRLPLNLVVAPRNRIEIVGSVLVAPDLAISAIEELETRTDRTGVASLVTGIGGLGTYPSMIPDTTDLPRAIETVAHEWTHHYLTLRPLGRAYFSSYEMRSVNETVADIVGEEIGRATYARYYGVNGSPTSPAPSTARSAPRARSDFGAEMRRIRLETERRLAAGDVAGAETYMAEQQSALRELGFSVRRLNTAYLSFFGVYSGGANRQESPLRVVRARSSTLAEFLEAVAGITRPEDLDRMARG